MFLVDTSVWIDFLRKGNALLNDLLKDGEVVTHPLIYGELSVGNLSKRKQFLSLFSDLPSVPECSHEEVLFMIESHKLYGKGIGYTDVHLLCSAIIHDINLWTLDKRLDQLIKTLNKSD
jgi:predicted nucleic acid-binding protein